MLTNFFTRANLRNIPAPSAWSVITTLLTIVVLQVALIAYLAGMPYLCAGAILNAAYVVYMAVR